MQLKMFIGAVTFLSLVIIWNVQGQLVSYGCYYEMTNITLNCMPTKVISLIKNKTVMSRDECAIDSTCCPNGEPECTLQTADVAPHRWRDLMQLCNGKQHCWTRVDWIASGGCFSSEMTSNNELITYSCEDFESSSTQALTAVTTHKASVTSYSSREAETTTSMLSISTGKSGTEPDDDDESGETTLIGAIVGGVCGVILGAVAVIVLLVVFSQRRKNFSQKEQKNNPAEISDLHLQGETEAVGYNNFASSNTLQDEYLREPTSFPNVASLQYEEIHPASTEYENTQNDTSMSSTQLYVNTAVQLQKPECNKATQYENISNPDMQDGATGASNQPYYNVSDPHIVPQRNVYQRLGPSKTAHTASDDPGINPYEQVK